MPPIRTRPALLLLIVLATFTVIACGDDDEGDSGGSRTATAQAEACSKDQLQLVSDGQLTVGTDKPAFPPYFVDNDPTNGKGFESAVACPWCAS
jgi:polar amino acid transport system substrate-binding protein